MLMDLAKTLEGLSAAATQGVCEVLAPDTEHDFGVPIVATDYPGTYGPTNGLVLWATMLPTEIDAKDTTRAQANAAFTAALWNLYRTGKLIVVDHPQATIPVDDRGGAVCEQQAVEAVARAIYGEDDFVGLGDDITQRMFAVARKAIAAMPSVSANDDEIARLRKFAKHFADQPCSCGIMRHIGTCGPCAARQALGGEA